jgi:hypothetical protein
MTREEIQKLRQTAFRRFYLRPSFLFKKLLGLRTINDVKVVLRSIRSLFWLAFKTDIFNRRTDRLHASR